MEQELGVHRDPQPGHPQGRSRLALPPHRGLAHLAGSRAQLRSKMDRRPACIEELREYGKTKCRWFLKERGMKRPHLDRCRNSSHNLRVRGRDASMRIRISRRRGLRAQQDRHQPRVGQAGRHVGRVDRQTKTGIRERRIAAPDEAPSDMGCQAALRCLTQRGRGQGRGRPDRSSPARRPISRSRRSPAWCRRSWGSPSGSARRST